VRSGAAARAALRQDFRSRMTGQLKDMYEAHMSEVAEEFAIDRWCPT